MFRFVESATEPTDGFRALPPRYHGACQDIPETSSTINLSKKAVLTLIPYNLMSHQARYISIT